MGDNQPGPGPNGEHDEMPGQQVPSAEAMERHFNIDAGGAGQAHDDAAETAARLRNEGTDAAPVTGQHAMAEHAVRRHVDTITDGEPAADWSKRGRHASGKERPDLDVQNLPGPGKHRKENPHAAAIVDNRPMGAPRPVDADRDEPDAEGAALGRIAEGRHLLNADAAKVADSRHYGAPAPERPTAPEPRPVNATDATLDMPAVVDTITPADALAPQPRQDLPGGLNRIVTPPASIAPDEVMTDVHGNRAGPAVGFSPRGTEVNPQGHQPMAAEAQRADTVPDIVPISDAGPVPDPHASPDADARKHYTEDPNAAPTVVMETSPYAGPQPPRRIGWGNRIRRLFGMNERYPKN